MFAARGNVWALDRARRVGRHVSVLAVCAVGIGVGLATPAQADKMGDTKAEANRVWEQIQSDGERLEATIERYNGAKFRLQQTMSRIHENEVRLSTARVNLKNARHALNISLISAYKNPQPDPLQAALEARNFGQVLEQFALLDRAQSYNASILTRHPRLPQGRRLEPARAQPRAQRAPRHGRRAGVAEGADPQLHRGRQAALPRPARQGAAPDRGAPQAEMAASRRVAEQQRQLQAASSDAGRRRQRHRRRQRRADPGVSVALPSPSTAGEAAANFALGSSARRTSGAAPRPAASTAPVSSRGPTARPASAVSRTSPARSGTRARTSPRRAISRPATSSSSTASGTWASTSAAATSCTRRTPATS